LWQTSADHTIGASEVRAAVLYENPASVIKADYTWRYTDRWINFPWSTEPSNAHRRPTA
jgi:hypoxanthine phosphoribosyltransferase